MNAKQQRLWSVRKNEYLRTLFVKNLVQFAIAVDVQEFFEESGFAVCA
jgi:hypothetical protein